MNHYTYQNDFKRIYDKALSQYQNGNRDKESYFADEEKSFISANGLRVQDFFDYAEDVISEEVPTYEVAQSIEQARREYFLHMQDQIPSTNTILGENLPPKNEELEGIVWLPRIIEKAKGKLRGELEDNIMYCCGGDRKFLKTHDIHPSEFLRLVWSKWDDQQAILDFVKKRSPSIA